MSLSPEELYLQLGNLVAEMPELGSGPITAEVNMWLGRACALVEEGGDTVATSQLKVACQFLTGPTRDLNAQQIATLVHTALAKAELNAPARVQGKFIAAGHTLDAYAAVGRVLGGAKTDVLMIDPYADMKIVTHYAVAAPNTVQVRILADTEYHKSTLKPAAEEWAQQFGQSRAPLEVRLAPARTLHDREIIVDGVDVFVLGQSFNALAQRAHTSIVRADAETAALKVAAYRDIWQNATTL
jgi:hypothetical protein